ncbi:MAG: SDR family NAD(P)-dependent oxidoreductase [Leptolyngbya sp. SIOISBB]|nr:SDR family NAD(P)-dependent oxidoreductase [Leptolyngbya sp. SIOISBB]
MNALELLDRPDYADAIAIIGMAGRFPGCSSLEDFWQHLQQGKELISHFSEAELLAAGVDPAIVADPHYVKASATLTQDVGLFDAAFFGLTPREAELTDPQHRLFLESAWEALETAGYDAEAYPGRVGVFAGVGCNTYLLTNLYPQRQVLESAGAFQTLIGNEKDFLSTQVAYKLNLTGAAVTVQTACSTSLVAVHLACQSLLMSESDMALAGGVSIKVPHPAGYYASAGGVFSADGHCRTFDAKAQGTVSGSGVGIVVLKRLETAVADGDRLYAIIRGSALNNDGSGKVGYTAPSIDGQAQVITEALAVAQVELDSISYIEAHGTATPLGDPIELAALTQAFRQTQRRGFCAIGSVKSNLGHLDAAAGVTGLIKTVLALQHRQIPPSLHFEQPNPQIDFAASPFYVNTALTDWATHGTPCRAGVSSFGIGGTNAHVIVEEAPIAPPASPSRPDYLLLFSAKTQSALDAAISSLTHHLDLHPEQDLADIAYTLQVGRQRFNHRAMLVCQSRDDAISTLQSRDPQRLISREQNQRDRPVIFLFPGQGAQHIQMGRALYDQEPLYRQTIDQCAEILQPILNLDIRTLLYPDKYPNDVKAPFPENLPPTPSLLQTAYAQPLLFIVEYALAQLWMSWGVRPQAVIGHSIGEYVAACLSGVFSLEAALKLIALRGRLMQNLPPGAMLSVALSEAEVRSHLSHSEELLAIAAVNAPKLTVVSGATEAIERLQNQLTQAGIGCRQLHTSHAFHSAMMTPILTEFAAQVRQAQPQGPRFSFISNVTGTWITATEATDPNYWATHLRQTVRFSTGITELLRDSDRLFLEVGPGQILTTLVRQHSSSAIALPSLRHPHSSESDGSVLLNTVGQMWLAGVAIDWSGFSAHEQRQRLPLPTYPFQRQRYWIDPPTGQTDSSVTLAQGRLPSADWYTTPVWQQSRSLHHSNALALSEHWLIFADERGIGTAIAQRLAQAGQQVTTVQAGVEFQQLATGNYVMNPQRSADYTTLLQQLAHPPTQIIHTWSLTDADAGGSDLNGLAERQANGFYSLLFLAQAIAKLPSEAAINLSIVTNQVQDVTGEEALCADKATLLGICRVMPQECPQIRCRCIDLVCPTEPISAGWLDPLWTELTAPLSEAIVALRGKRRWIQTFAPVQLEGSQSKTPHVEASSHSPPLRQRGVYLITGGLGGIGLTLARHLAETVQAKLILLGRSALPDAERWSDWLATHAADDPTSQKIRDLQTLESLGAEVLALQADITDREQVQRAIAQSQQRFGNLHGVIHAAGVAGGGMIQLKTQAAADQVIAPKLKGALLLTTLLSNQPLDFMLFCSSLSAILGGFGQVDYCAANAVLDAIAHYQTSRCDRFTVSVNWDTWQSVGMAVNTAIPEELKQYRQASLQEGITPDEGAASFSHILQSGLPQVIVSFRDWQTRVTQSQTMTISAELAQLEADALPQTAQSTHTRPHLPTAYVEPHTETEKAIATIWQELLGIAPIGIHDNFFELGGHSLLAIQVLSRLQAAFNREVGLHHLFERPTITDLATVLSESEAISTLQPASISPIPQQQRVREQINHLPLSFAQQRLWFTDQLAPGNPIYNIPAAIRLVGNLNDTALSQTLEAIGQRHEVLRTSFTVADGQPMQVIHPASTFTLNAINFNDITRDVSPSDRASKLNAVMLADAQRPFDLSQEPLWRVTLIQLSATEQILLLVMHHIIADAWSIGVLLKEVATLYAAFAAGQPSPLAALPIQYADYAIWQRHQLQGQRLDDLLAYWQRQLANLPTLKLPTLPASTSRSLHSTPQGAIHSFTIPPTVLQQLQTLSQQVNVTLFMTLLATFQILLYRQTQQADIVVGTDVANRDRVETESLLGFFINLLVLRTDLSGNPRFRELLDRVRQTTLSAYAHQDLPFAKLVETLHPERHLHQTPLFQVLFVLQNAPMPPLQLPGLRLEPVSIDTEVARFDLALFLTETEDGLLATWRYNRDRFSTAEIEQWSGQFETLLNSATANPDARIQSLEWRTKTEQQQQQVAEAKQEASKRNAFKSTQPKAMRFSSGESLK